MYFGFGDVIYIRLVIYGPIHDSFLNSVKSAHNLQEDVMKRLMVTFNDEAVKIW